MHFWTTNSLCTLEKRQLIRVQFIMCQIAGRSSFIGISILIFEEGAHLYIHFKLDFKAHLLPKATDSAVTQTLADLSAFMYL